MERSNCPSCKKVTDHKRITRLTEFNEAVDQMSWSQWLVMVAGVAWLPAAWTLGVAAFYALVGPDLGRCQECGQVSYLED